MTLNDFLILVAPQLTLFACVALVFVWATKAKAPAFLDNQVPAPYEEEVLHESEKTHTAS
ncbi:cytochrome bd oxidase small subunit CydS [Alkalicoccus chagannorensis]|uniref:cytochrome bd oxidase small subunit CydS n=1 Tax=Alkalicoccus chagannorensis TaxID=427072 RepID=UPI0004249812|nr:hypothetical protein [Alkalicoccus chagannorensis]